MNQKIHIGILGGGPSGLFMFKRLLESQRTDIVIHVVEQKDQLGSGMPYSPQGANDEHVTNVSGNEIPELVTSLNDWIHTVHPDTLRKYHIDPERFNDYKVLPRLLFGYYLASQFRLLQQQAKDAGIEAHIHYNTSVNDVTDHPDLGKVHVDTDQGPMEFDRVIICTGHVWPKKDEGRIPDYFDSPYPPVKLALQLDHPVAVKGASLTAIDALRTLSRHNGTYGRTQDGRLCYTLNPESEGFRLVMHSRNGLLPAVRFHLEDPYLSAEAKLSPEDVAADRAANDGFLSLDNVFEKAFKDSFKEKRPAFYEQIKDMSVEDFVDRVMSYRQDKDPFDLFKAEYEEAEISIEERESVYWKEMLAVLSFAMNYPAKYFSAEDMLRLQKTLMPLISVVIAFVPQSSVEEMLALHEAGVLELISVSNDSDAEPHPEGGAVYHYGEGRDEHFKTFVNCVGQPHLYYDDIPFAGLREKGSISAAKVQFRDAEAGLKQMNEGNKQVTTDGKGNYYLKVAGVTINDHFALVDDYGAYNERIYMMAVSCMGGYNPDYSGLDFCEKASACVMETLLG